MNKIENNLNLCRKFIIDKCDRDSYNQSLSKYLLLLKDLNYDYSNELFCIAKAIDILYSSNLKFMEIYDKPNYKENDVAIIMAFDFRLADFKKVLKVLDKAITISKLWTFT